MVDASGEQTGSLSGSRERTKRANLRLRIVLDHCCLWSISLDILWTTLYDRGIPGRDQNRPTRCCATRCTGRKFALLNRRLRSFFDRTEVRERAVNLISQVSHLLSGSPTRWYIHLRCFLSLFSPFHRRFSYLLPWLSVLANTCRLQSSFSYRNLFFDNKFYSITL